MATQTEIKTAVERAEKVFAARPEEGRITKSVNVTLQDGICCRAEDGGHSVLVDMPEAFGGEDAGPNPGFYLRSALGSCTLISFAYALAKREIPYSDISIRVESDMDLGGGFGIPGAPKGTPSTRLFVRIASSAARAEIEAALAEAEANTIVGNVVRHGTDLTRHLEVIPTAAAAE